MVGHIGCMALLVDERKKRHYYGVAKWVWQNIIS
jgi:hypothetical protein